MTWEICRRFDENAHSGASAVRVLIDVTACYRFDPLNRAKHPIKDAMLHVRVRDDQEPSNRREWIVDQPITGKTRSKYHLFVSVLVDLVHGRVYYASVSFTVPDPEADVLKAHTTGLRFSTRVAEAKAVNVGGPVESLDRL